MIRALLFWLALTLPLAAQDLPDWQHTSINDFAGLLTPQDAQALDQALIALHDDTGAQGTVVTLTDRARYGSKAEGLESFATRLFNDWGIGEAQRDNGFMVLVLTDEREARIELGAGYDSRADDVAQAIIEQDMLPDFRAGNLSQGIRAGTVSVIENIARPHAAGMGYTGPVPDPDKNPAGWIAPLGAIGFFLFVAFRIFSRFWDRIRLRHRPCPNCGGSGLIRESEIIQPEDGSGQASQVTWTRCPRCNWTGPRSESDRSRAPGSDRSSGGFGGGRSSGGGASGRW